MPDNVEDISIAGGIPIASDMSKFESVYEQIGFGIKTVYGCGYRLVKTGREKRLQLRTICTLIFPRPKFGVLAVDWIC